jgi:hypothetical protein
MGTDAYDIDTNKRMMLKVSARSHLCPSMNTWIPRRVKVFEPTDEINRTDVCAKESCKPTYSLILSLPTGVPCYDKWLLQTVNLPCVLYRTVVALRTSYIQCVVGRWWQGVREHPGCILFKHTYVFSFRWRTGSRSSRELRQIRPMCQ